MERDSSKVSSELHVMVDIETTGTDPSHAAMIQLAAVKFTLEPVAIIQPFFDASLSMPANRYWSEDTRSWWAKRPKVYQEITSKQRPPREVMLEFNQWVNQDLQGRELHFWAKPTSFEWPFLESYFRDTEVLNPFSFAKAVDVRSFMRARLGRFDIRAWEAARPMEGTAHNAISDVLHQIRLVLEANSDGSGS